MIESTFALIKPDAVKAGHTKAILQTANSYQLVVSAQKQMRLTEEQVRQLYATHVTQPHFPALLQLTTSGDVIAFILSGDDCVRKWRTVLGPTNSAEAPAHTIRGMYGNPNVIRENAVHGSDTSEGAVRGANLFFGPNQTRQEQLAVLKALHSSPRIRTRLVWEALYLEVRSGVSYEEGWPTEEAKILAEEGADFQLHKAITWLGFDKSLQTIQTLQKVQYGQQLYEVQL